MAAMATEAVAVARDEGWLARLRRNRVLRRLRQHKLFLTGFALFAVVLVMAVFAPLIAPLPPDEIQFRHRFEPPSLAFPMGTDNFGRDLLSRVVYGARLSLEIGFTVVLLTGIFGTAIGAAAGYYRKLDNPLMRVMDALMAFPAILLAVAIAAALGASAVNAVIALAAVYTPRTARIVRASVLVVREMEYVQAARACGATNWRIMRRHILPNSMAPLIVQLVQEPALTAVLALTASRQRRRSNPRNRQHRACSTICSTRRSICSINTCLGWR